MTALDAAPLVSGTCPTWCTGEHDATFDFHRSRRDAFLGELKVHGEHPEISVYAERYIDEDGTERETRVVIDGEHSECSGVELSIADAARVAGEVERLLDILRGASV